MNANIQAVGSYETYHGESSYNPSEEPQEELRSQ